MERRHLLKAGLAAAATTLATPAVASDRPLIKWRLTSSFPRSLDTIYAAAEVMSRQVAEATDGRFEIQVFAANEIVGGFQAFDAVSNGTVEMCHTLSYYYVGKDPTFAVATAIPFGLNSRQQNAWMYQGGGIELFNAFYKQFGVIAFPAGNSGAQMGGWFRKEIISLQDLQGLKMRIPGISGQVMKKLGVIPQQIPGGDIFSALERGTIDAAEWVGPHDDEKLGFVRVAPYYYYPGWWEGGAVIHAMMNINKWSELPKSYQAALFNAAAYANCWMQARYDNQNPAALRRLISAGALLRPFPPDVMEAAHREALELYKEISEQSPNFKTAMTALMAYRTEAYMWWQVAEYNYDAFMIKMRRM